MNTHEHEHSQHIPMRLLVTGATGFIGSRLALHAHRSSASTCSRPGAPSIDVERERLAELRAADVPRAKSGMLQDAASCDVCCAAARS